MRYPSRSLLKQAAVHQSLWTFLVERVKSFTRVVCSGHMMDLLSISGQARLGDWIDKHGFLDKGRFAVSMTLPYGVALYCVCEMDFNGDEPLIAVKDVMPGLENMTPSSMRDMNIIMMGTEDLETPWTNVDGTEKSEVDNV